MKELNQNAMHLITRENRNSKRYIQPNVHWSTIYNTQDTEATQMPINGGTDKEDVVHTHNEYYSAMKKRMKWCHLQKHEWIYKWSKAEKKIEQKNTNSLSSFSRLHTVWPQVIPPELPNQG